MSMATSIRIRGQVQGVGFRPFVWHLATRLGITGNVLNDDDGVLIHAWGESPALENFRRQLSSDVPPLARIDSLEYLPIKDLQAPAGFEIVDSRSTGRISVSVAPDAATCPACLADIFDPLSRHYGYPFTSCTHCGPRLSITRSIPFDRPNTSMAPFSMCDACSSEYNNPADRRFHAQAHACPQCGPQLWFADAHGRRLNAPDGLAMDSIDLAAAALREGSIVAIKGIGGFHLAVDACNTDAVERLRARKQRDAKPFALMAADLESVTRFAHLDTAEAELMTSTEAPIVLLARKSDSERVADGVAPGQERLGFMLPYSPLHSLLMQRLEHPIVLTSGNLSDEPQCIDNNDALHRLSCIADAFLLHDREIVNRLDDSVAVVMAGLTHLLRRARGYAPAPLLLHDGFAAMPRVLAMGAEMKSTFCQLDTRQGTGKAVISQHIGDLENAASHDDFLTAMNLYAQMYGFEPQAIAVDKHPDYFSTRIGTDMSGTSGIPLIAVQHHHAHIAAVMAEHRMPPGNAPVLGVALDGLGYSEDGTIWGGEFLLADFTQYRRLGCFGHVPMPGGTRAIREPWRNTFAHLDSLGWDDIEATFSETDILKYLGSKPIALLRDMLGKQLNSPLTSSCGRLFDAVAAALGICRDEVSYEGQAAIELETLAWNARKPQQAPFPYAIDNDEENGLLTINWKPMWTALLGALSAGEDRAVLAASFHQTVSAAVCDLAVRLCHEHAVSSVVLCGGSFQNRLLLESVTRQLVARGLHVLSAQHLPLGDGGLALGQAAVAAATLQQGTTND